ncbi:MAG: FtsH protease activity modulator HflK [Desulforegulaceae bacterium]|jgi:membrane protease subunit HflK|nr:FtsH protease activity modulator HflK [Desulforegulaceae bacterium]
MNWDWDKLREQQKKQQNFNQSPGGGGGNGLPPMDDFVNFFKGKKLPAGLIILGLIVAFLLFFGNSMFFTIDTSEVGIVQRFGKYDRTVYPGLNFKFPAGIEKVTKVKIKRVFKEEFGFTTLSTTQTRSLISNQDSNDVENVSLMLTGDLNVALVPWIVQFKVKDPYKYLFKIHDARQVLRDLSESTMRLVVGDRSINEVITKREEMALQAMENLQKALDSADAGIDVVTIEMKRTNVPLPVQPSFNQVNQATQEKEEMIYNAKEEYNKAIPAAMGEAEREIRQAEGYALNRINRAKGDAQRFTAVYEEYKNAKDITKRRLYLEMLNELIPKMQEKYIIDEDQNNILPFLNLGKASK